LGTVSPWQMAGGFCTLLNPASDLHSQHLVDLETSASRSRGSPVEALATIPPPGPVNPGGGTDRNNMTLTAQSVDRLTVRTVWSVRLRLYKLTVCTNISSVIPNPCMIPSPPKW
jgi:hypothetical protein